MKRILKIYLLVNNISVTQLKTIYQTTTMRMRCIFNTSKSLTCVRLRPLTSMNHWPRPVRKSGLRLRSTAHLLFSPSLRSAAVNSVVNP